MKKKKHTSTPKWLIYAINIFLVALLILLIILWRGALEESSWIFQNFLRDRRSLTLFIFLLVLLPWKGIFLELRDFIKSKIKKQDIVGRLKNSIPKFNVFDKSLIRRLFIAICLLIIYIFFSSKFIVIEVPMSKRMEQLLPNSWAAIQYAYSQIIYLLQSVADTVYIMLGKYFNLRVAFFITGLILIRFVIRFLIPSFFDRIDNYILRKVNQSLRYPNFSRFAAYILVSIIFLGGISYIFRQDETRFRIVPTSITDTFINGEFNIHSIDKRSLLLTGSLTLFEREHEYTPEQCDYDYSYECTPAEGVPELIANKGVLYINNTPVPIDTELRGIKKEIQLRLSGNDYLFPFNKYYAQLEICSHRYSWEEQCYYYYPFSDNVPHIRDYTNITVSLSDGNRAFKIYPSDYDFSFFIEYTWYYKLLVGAIMVTLFIFLIAIWNANDRGQLIELSVGIFATIITLRGFIIPQDLVESPIFLDQVLLVYIGLFLFTLLYKYSITKQTNDS